MNWTSRVRALEVAPSLYAADFWDLGAQIETLLDAGTRIFHVDVGDGHFVRPVTIGPIVIESIAPRLHEHGALIDVHLMVTQPERQFEAVAAAGGDSVTFHFEVAEEPGRAIAAARDLGLGVGIAFNPETDPEQVAEVASRVDLVLCMSIHPGYSGQEFMPEALDRIQRLRRLLPETLIQVDGGVAEGSARDLYEAGARLLVVGTAIFAPANIGDAYRRIHAAALDGAGAEPDVATRSHDPGKGRI